MTGGLLPAVQFGNDAASFQGDVSWSQVDRAMAFGWEKVTQGGGPGFGYVNPRWFPEKPEMKARAGATGFIPGGYLFLEAGDGAAQADRFAQVAGDMTGFAIAVDVEPTATSRPGMATARACVARLRAHYPGKPIGGYIPHWYWGEQDTDFTDYLWSSRYVSAGPAGHMALFARVTPDMWAGYGGSPVTLLQFTDRALIAGVAGSCDCSAFLGTVAELRHVLLGDPTHHRFPPEDDVMQPAFLVKGEQADTPLAIPNTGRRLRFFSNHPAEVRVDWVGVDAASADLTLGYDEGPVGKDIPDGCRAAVAHRVDAGDNEVSFVISP